MLPIVIVIVVMLALTGQQVMFAREVIASIKSRGWMSYDWLWVAIVAFYVAFMGCLGLLVRIVCLR